MKVVIPEDVLVQDLGGESVLLNLENEQYYGLDDVGTSMWQALEKTGSLEAALEVVQEQYEVEPEQLRQDFQELVEQLVENGLLKIVEAE